MAQTADQDTGRYRQAPASIAFFNLLLADFCQQESTDGFLLGT